MKNCICFFFFLRVFTLDFIFAGNAGTDSDSDTLKNASDRSEDLECVMKGSLKLNEALDGEKVIKSTVELRESSVNSKSEVANITSDMLKNEIDSVALEWKTLRNIVECNCSTPFDYSTRKVRIF